MAGRNRGRGRGRGRSQSQNCSKIQVRGRCRIKKSLDTVQNETINGGTSDGKHKRSIISNSDSSDDEKKPKRKINQHYHNYLHQSKMILDLFICRLLLQFYKKIY